VLFCIDLKLNLLVNLKDEQGLRVFDKRVPRGIFGPGTEIVIGE
jgi:hypothetical protein